MLAAVAPETMMDIATTMDLMHKATIVSLMRPPSKCVDDALEVETICRLPVLHSPDIPTPRPARAAPPQPLRG